MKSAEFRVPRLRVNLSPRPEWHEEKLKPPCWQGVGGVGGVGGNAAFIDVQLFNFSSFSPLSPHLPHFPLSPHLPHFPPSPHLPHFPLSPHSKILLYQGFAINLVPFPPAPYPHNAKKSIDSAQVAILCFGNST